MGMRSLVGWNWAWIALLAAALGCEDRLRPTGAPPPGDGLGPTATVLSPAENDTVQLGKTFNLDVQLSDPDGIDSVWVTLNPNVNTLTRFGGFATTTQTVGYTVLMPDSVGVTKLKVMVQGTDMLGDTGAVFTRSLWIKP